MGCTKGTPEVQSRNPSIHVSLKDLQNIDTIQPGSQPGLLLGNSDVDNKEKRNLPKPGLSHTNLAVPT